MEINSQGVEPRLSDRLDDLEQDSVPVVENTMPMSALQSSQGGDRDLSRRPSPMFDIVNRRGVGAQNHVGVRLPPLLLILRGRFG